MKTKKRNNGNRPTLKVKPRSYQPTKAELEEDLSVPTTPEHLAKCITRTVKIEEVG